MKMGVDKEMTVDRIAKGKDEQLAIQLALQTALQNALATVQSKNSNINNKTSEASYKASCTASSPWTKNSKNIQDIISKTSKNFNVNYRNSIDSRRQDEYKYRLDKVLRTIKPWYSEDGYMDILRSLQRASHFEKIDFIRNMEKVVAKRRKTT
tara:strand:- start:10 stop:468 length:459 start_codon:yes stop_codon:yes gene_type:complete